MPPKTFFNLTFDLVVLVYSDKRPGFVEGRIFETKIFNSICFAQFDEKHGAFRKFYFGRGVLAQ